MQRHKHPARVLAILLAAAALASCDAFGYDLYENSWRGGYSVASSAGAIALQGFPAEGSTLTLTKM